MNLTLESPCRELLDHIPCRVVDGRVFLTNINRGSEGDAFKSKKEDDFDSGDDGKCKGGSKNSMVSLERSDQQPSKHDVEKRRS
ncbi:hypothetical protein L195_g022106 [Trifolium pratense]|uniref:Uncharacterized protein n=1 Tax=Trifolium pratense TaxID=57577 RepID=A0A2K3N736_TRIPR|nr:hypothetical protein L195_g022106 [Trifolium pratense]